MKRIALTLAVAALAFAGGAYASGTWHVFATATDQGDYGAYASASASASKPHALAARVSAEADLNWSISCDGTTHVRAGALVALTVAAAGSCRVYGSASTDKAGSVKVELLKR